MCSYPERREKTLLHSDHDECEGFGYERRLETDFSPIVRDVNTRPRLNLRMPGPPRDLNGKFRAI